MTNPREPATEDDDDIIFQINQEYLHLENSLKRINKVYQESLEEDDQIIIVGVTKIAFCIIIPCQNFFNA